MSNKIPKICLDISQTVFQGGVVTYTKNLARLLNKNRSVEMEFLLMSLTTSSGLDLRNVRKVRVPSNLQDLLLNQ